jgi:hypothetical protein
VGAQAREAFAQLREAFAALLLGQADVFLERSDVFALLVFGLSCNEFCDTKSW